LPLQQVAIARGIQYGEIMPEQRTFSDRAAFRTWLQKNHDQTEGLWLVFGKNNMIRTLTPEQALEEALCFGWIDGPIKRVDEKQPIKFFSRRRNKSNWSEKNKRAAERLIQTRRMTAPGLKAIDKAKQTGSWDSPVRPVVTQEDIKRFARMIASNTQAAANFQKMPQSLRKQYTGFYLDAKQEATQKRRLAQIIRHLEQNKRLMR
jgi:uncharacterized protein YdeI (YjbR/CyaY-like superfamily)